MEDRANQLGEERIWKLLLKFSIPAIVGMLVNALYNIVDRIFIGRGVGTLAIAGITIGFPVMTILMALGMLIGLGATSLVSIRLGENKRDEAELIMTNALVLLVSVLLGASVLGLIFLNPMLRLFGASGEVLPYAKAYLRIILIGAVFQGVGFGMNNMIRAQGNPHVAMMTMLIGAILNTLLDPLFIFVFGWGIEGAALATILSQAVSAAWVLRYLFSDQSSLKMHMKNAKLQREIVIKIIAIGSAPFMMQVAASAVMALLNHQLRIFGGDVSISAMGVIYSIAMMIMMPIFGINQGSQPIIGFNYGAKKFDRVKKALTLAIGAATAIVLLGFIIVQLFPENLFRLFNNKDMELVAFGTQGIRIYLMMLPIIGFQIVSANYFQAVGKPKQAMILSLSRQVLVFIPALLILPRFYALKGVWAAAPTADLVSSIITGIWLAFEMKHLNDSHADLQINRGTIQPEQ